MREVSPWAARLEAAIALLLIAGTAALAAFEARSGLAGALSSGRPVLGLVIARNPDPAEPPALWFLAYHPATRSMEVMDIPAVEAPQARGRTLAQLYRQAYARRGDPRDAADSLMEPALRIVDPAGGLALPDPAQLSARDTPQGENSRRLDFTWMIPAPEETHGSGPELRRTINAWPRGLSFWVGAALAVRRWGLPRGISSYEAALFSWEAYRLSPADARRVWLPAAALRRPLLDLLLAPPAAAAEESRIKTEILNASGEAGVALSATKVLRSERIDVLDYGNSTEVEPQTRLVDRLGRPNDARRAAELLGCPEVEIWTQFDPQASVPLTVVLGRDFRRCRRL